QHEGRKEQGHVIGQSRNQLGVGERSIPARQEGDSTRVPPRGGGVVRERDVGLSHSIGASRRGNAQGDGGGLRRGFDRDPERDRGEARKCNQFHELTSKKTTGQSADIG